MCQKVQSFIPLQSDGDRARKRLGAIWLRLLQSWLFFLHTSVSSRQSFSRSPTHNHIKEEQLLTHWEGWKRIHPKAHTCKRNHIYSCVQSAFLQLPQPPAGPWVGYTNGLQNLLFVGGHSSVFAPVSFNSFHLQQLIGEQTKGTTQKEGRGLIRCQGTRRGGWGGEGVLAG